MRLSNDYDISFKDDKGVYEICGYPGPQKEENMFIFIARISAMIESDIARAKRIKKIPMIIQKLILHYEKNGRIKQYINKKYLSSEERFLWGYREPVVLYNL